MKTLQRFSKVIDAQISQSFLLSHGINSQIRDQHIVSINWFYSNVVGGVKLEVKDEEFNRAKILLQQVEDGVHKLAEQELVGMECPLCKSVKSELKPNVIRGWILIMAYTTGLPFLFLNRDRWQCFDCQHKWSFRRSLNLLNIIIPAVIASGLYLVFSTYFKE